MALREFAFFSVPWPAMNSVMSFGLGARGKGNCSTIFFARDKNDFRHAFVSSHGLAVVNG